MIALIRARRAELVQTHDALVTQHAQVATTLERVRGALTLCDELLTAAAAASPGAAPPADD